MTIVAERVLGGVDRTGLRPFCGHFVPSGGVMVLESNNFPVVGSWYSLSFHLSARALNVANPVTATYGLVGFDPSFTVATFYRSEQVLLSGGTETTGFLHLKALYQASDDTPEMCFRLEVENCFAFWIDNVLVDPHEGQYDYFDGNSDESFPEDFRWMGGRANNHFSLWYNNYTNTRNRLFSDWDTEEQVYKGGLVEEWAPTGSNIVDHWDAVTSFTPLNWVGPAFYPIQGDTSIGVTDIDFQKDSIGNVLPETT